jgi:CelD/BcsL family acetyltransferase involved in cellulose biosynthesis
LEVRTLHVTTVTREAEFDALKDEWNAAADLAVAPSIFLRHEWFSAAWAWRRLDSTLALIVARNDGKLAGVLPLIRSAPRNKERRLELLTVPDTQVADLVAARGELADVAEAFAAALARRKDWDTLWLDYLLPEGATVAALASAMRRHRLHVIENERGENPFVSLEGAWADYYNTRSRSLKKALNLAANRLHRTGEIRVEWITPATDDESRFQSALDSAIDISRRSWKSDTGNALDQPGPQGFIRALSGAAYQRGWASIWLLHVDRKVLAMEYQLIDNGNVHALRADFDASCVEISPGSHLFGELLQRLFQRGLRRYFLGPGDNPYKKRWTNDGESLLRIIVYNRTWRGRRAWLRDVVLKPALRRLRDRFVSPRTEAPQANDPQPAVDHRK